MQCTCPTSTETRPILAYQSSRASQRKRQVDQSLLPDDAEMPDTSIAEPGKDERSDWECLEIDDPRYTDEDLKDLGRPGRRRHVGDQDPMLFSNEQEPNTMRSGSRDSAKANGQNTQGKIGEESRPHVENAIDAMNIRLQRAGNAVIPHRRTRSTCSMCGRKRAIELRVGAEYCSQEHPAEGQGKRAW
jgi:hypothetical protein